MKADVDYQKELRKIGEGVDKLVYKNPEALEEFRRRIEPLAQRWDAYQQAIERGGNALLAHWELVKKRPGLQNKKKRPTKKGEEGWEWDASYLWGVPHPKDEKVKPPICYMPARLGDEYLKALNESIKENRNKLRIPDPESRECEQLNGVAMRKKLEIPRPGSRKYEKLSNTIRKQEKQYQETESELRKIPEAKRAKERVYAGYGWYRSLYGVGEGDEKAFGCWRPKRKPLPEKPLERLKPSLEEYKQQPQQLQRLEPATDKNEQWERYYVFLSSVHDNCLPEVESITRGIWPDDLAEAVWHCCGEFFGHKDAFLRCALNRVRAEIERKGAKAAEGKTKSLS